MEGRQCTAPSSLGLVLRSLRALGRALGCRAWPLGRLPGSEVDRGLMGGGRYGFKGALIFNYGVTKKVTYKHGPLPRNLDEGVLSLRSSSPKNRADRTPSHVRRPRRFKERLYYAALPQSEERISSACKVFLLDSRKTNVLQDEEIHISYCPRSKRRSQG